MIRIVDVFEGNGPVNWAAVRATGFTAAIHKATQYRIDRLFMTHHADIPATGLHHGCYHFLNWDVPVADQVALYRGTVGLPSGAGHFPWVIDYEKYNGQLPTPDQLDEFLTKLGAGPSTLLYGNRWDLANLGTRFIGRVKVWLAEYGPNNGSPNGDPQLVRRLTQFPPTDVVMWQYTSMGSVPGIAGNVDVSMWLGTDAEYAAYVGSQPAPEEEDMYLRATDPKTGEHAMCDRDGNVITFNPDGTIGGTFLGTLVTLRKHFPTFTPLGPVVAFWYYDDHSGRPNSAYVMVLEEPGKTTPDRFHPANFPADGSLK